MSTYRLRTPDKEIDLGDIDNAEEALEIAADRHNEAHLFASALEVKVGQTWHEVKVEGDMS